MFQENQFNVEELLKDKNIFFHIGIPGLTKELENDRMILLAARTGMGKTRLLTRIANGACINFRWNSYCAEKKELAELFQLASEVKLFELCRIWKRA